MKKIVILLSAIMGKFGVNARKRELQAASEIGFVTILNRFNNMTLDMNDEIYLPWDEHFDYTGDNLDQSSISFEINTERFSEWIRPTDQKMDQKLREQVYINASGIWHELRDEEKKEFSAEVCVVHDKVDHEDPSQSIKYKLCQDLHGIVLDIDNNEYYIPRKLDTLGYFQGTVPTLPYSFTNLFNSDFKFSMPNVTKVGSKGNTTYLDKLPFDYSFNLPSEKQHFQWTKVIKEVPMYWKFHSQGKYLIYVTQENSYVNPALRVFKKNENNELEVLKGRRIDPICKNFDEVFSENFNENTLIVRCRGTGEARQRVYAFYKVSIINERIVMTEKVMFDASYQNCSRIYLDKKDPTFVPKMACVRTMAKEGLGQFASELVIFDIYDEPLEFIINPLTSLYSLKNLRERIPGYVKAKEGQYVSRVRNIFFRKSHEVNLYINHEVYEVSEENGTQNFKEALNVIQLISMGGRYSYYQMFDDYMFNEELIFCPADEILLIYNRRDNIMRGHKNHTVYNMRTNYLKNTKIIKIHCMIEDSKFSIIFKEIYKNRRVSRQTKVAAYCTKYAYRATTRLFYIQDVPNKNAQSILPFCYDKSAVSSYMNKAKLAIFYVIPPLRFQKQALGEDESTISFNMKIMEFTKENDYPRLKLNFTKSDPGTYEINFNVTNSLGFRKTLRIPIEVFCRNKLEFVQNREIVESPQLLQSIIRNESKLGIYDLKSRFRINGSFLNAELRVEDQELRDQVKLVLPVNYIGYFSGKGKTTTYDAMVTVNDTVYLINQSYLDVYKIDVSKKEKQRDFHRFRFEDKFEQNVLHFHVEHIRDQVGEDMVIFFTVSQDTSKKLYIHIFEMSQKSISGTSYNIVCDDVVKIPIEKSESFLEVEKFEIRRVKDNKYVMIFSRDFRTVIEIHKLEKKKDRRRKDDQLHWQKEQRLHVIDDNLVGISNFFFNDFTTMMVEDSLEVVLTMDTSILVIKFCTEYGLSLEFFDVGELYRYCVLRKIGCFQNNVVVKNSEGEFMNSECIVATEGAQMHKLIIKRKRFKTQLEPTTQANLSDGLGIDTLHSIFKIQSMTCNRFFFFPFNDVPVKLNLGIDYFAMGTESSGFMAVYDRHSSNRFPIGSVWKPYGVKTHLAFTRSKGSDYLLQISEKSSAKIYSLGDFYIKFLNPSISLENVTLNFNSKLLSNEPGVPQRSTVLKINKRPKNVEDEEGSLDFFDNDNWKMAMALFVGICILVICCLISREEKRRKRIKNKMSKLNRYKRKMRVEMERREIMKIIKGKSMSDLEQVETEEEAYGLVKEGGW